MVDIYSRKFQPVTNHEHRWRLLIVRAALSLFVSTMLKDEFSGNLVTEMRMRHANYDSVTSALRCEA
jgi:hypothetical protein